MKRLLPVLIMAALAFAGMAQPATAEDASVANVHLDMYSFNGQQTVYASQYDPTGPYEYWFSPCEPSACGTIVITGKKKPSVKLSLLPGQTFIRGGYSYRNNDCECGKYGSWDGSALPLTIKVKDKKGKPVTLTLSVWSDSHLEGAPVPPPFPTYPGGK